MSHVQGRVCPFNFKSLGPVSLALLVAGLAHAATQTVPCSGSGGGASGLVAAIDTANSTPGPNTINLTPGCVYILTTTHEGNGSSQNGLAPITGTLTVNGYGATVARTPVYVGTSSFRIFSVLAGGNLTLNTVTVKGGSAGLSNGGPSPCPDLVAGDLIFNGGSGGGVCVEGGGNLTLNHSTVTENSAGSIEGSVEGGGIYNAGNVTLNYSVVSKNSVSSNEFPSSGGGIYSQGQLTLQSSTVTHNTANTGSEDTSSSADGGGIVSAGTLIMRHSLVSYNTVGAGGESSSGSTNGGGIHIAAGSTAILDHSVIRNNMVTSSTGGSSESTAVAAGAGIAIDGTASLDHVVLFGNRATASLVPGFPGNSAITTARGGGLAISGKATLLHTFVDCNIARAPDGVARGGGIDNGDTGTATLEHSKVINDTAEGNTLANSLGGGIYNANPASGSVTLTLTQVKGNHPDQCDPTGSVPGCSN